MLLTNKNETIIEIDKVKVNLKITFKVLENIYNLLQDKFVRKMLALEANSPFELIQNIDENKNIKALIYCLADGKLSIKVINEAVDKFENNNIEILRKIIRAAIISSMFYIDDNEKDNDNQDTGKKKDEDKFEEYYNYLYLSSVTQLGFSKNQFYNSTPSELKQLLNNNLMHKKSALLRAYIDVMDSRNPSKDKGKKNLHNKKVKDANDFFDLI